MTSFTGSALARAQPLAPYVIVAEDDDAMRDLLCTMFRKLRLGVVEAKNGRVLMDHLRACGGWLPVLVLTDLEMPELTGMRALRQMRRARIDVPVILITAFGSENVHRDALRHGALAVFDKPFSLATLRQLAVRILGEAA
jgi:two-component system, NtrC family, response regulator AtoC